MADIFDLTDAWNDAGATFCAIKMDVTDSASQAGSMLIDLQVGGSSKFAVRKDGVATMPFRSEQSDIAAAGANQSAATAITTRFTTVISGSGGIRLPAMLVGEGPFYIFNNTTTVINLYPASGEQISERGANNPVILMGKQGYLIVVRADGRAMVFFGGHAASDNYPVLGAHNGVSFVTYDTSSGALRLINGGGLITDGSIVLSHTGGRAFFAGTGSPGQSRIRGIIDGDVTFRDIMRFITVSAGVNYINATNAVIAGSPKLSAAGDDANIDLVLESKGSGLLRFGSHSSIAAETVTGYVTIKDAGGTTRKLAVVS